MKKQLLCCFRLCAVRPVLDANMKSPMQICTNVAWKHQWRLHVTVQATPLAVFYFFPVKIRNRTFNATFKNRDATDVVVVDVAGQNHVSMWVDVYHGPGFALPSFFFSHHSKVTHWINDGVSFPLHFHEPMGYFRYFGSRWGGCVCVAVLVSYSHRYSYT